MMQAARSRRAILKSAFVFASGAAVSACVTSTVETAAAPAAPLPLPPAPKPLPPAPVAVAAAPVQRPTAPPGVRPEIFQRAIAALDRHSMQIERHDRIAVADFTTCSNEARFHLINLGDGRTTSLLVAHGSGSDPEHTGFLHRFSNAPGSNATSEGAYLTSNYYVGKHDLSQRLIGLDYTNNNALDRAIVVHSAWYANPEMIEKHGVLGRSQGCFAVGNRDLDIVFAQLGQGRMIYASKL